MDNKPKKMQKKAASASKGYQERITILLLEQMSRVEPGTSAYNLLLDQLNHLSESDAVPPKERCWKYFEKRLKEIPHILKMPRWFQLGFLIVLFYFVVLFVDAAGFWFGFDLLHNDPPPANVKSFHSQHSLHFQSPEIP